MCYSRRRGLTCAVVQLWRIIWGRCRCSLVAMAVPTERLRFTRDTGSGSSRAPAELPACASVDPIVDVWAIPVAVQAGVCFYGEFSESCCISISDGVGGRGGMQAKPQTKYDQYMCSPTFWLVAIGKYCRIRRGHRRSPCGGKRSGMPPQRVRSRWSSTLVGISPSVCCGLTRGVTCWPGRGPVMASFVLAVAHP